MKSNTQQKKNLAGKVAIVTGAGSEGGIGAATARVLCESGARVVLADISDGDLEQTTASLAADGYEVASCAVDISIETSAHALVDFAVTRFGGLDILDNNAAAIDARDGLVGNMTVELWDELMTVNARGTMLMCKHALPAMIARGGGSIVNISSGTSAAGGFSATAYACSKGAINTLTRYVATQYGARGIRANAIISGLIATSRLAEAMPEQIQDIFRQYNLTNRLGEPRDVAEIVEFLASDRSRYITGQLLPVDGGIYAHIPTTVEVERVLAGGRISSS
jgi:NAD(P)-dependent dehydrogenase (short-subunit alcohol dehydrogenase family)